MREDEIVADGAWITTARLVMRPWHLDDAEQALAIYGSARVARWLTPALPRIEGLDAMRAVLTRWREASSGLVAPRGRWAIQDRASAEVVGGAAVLALPPGEEDLELAWQLAPNAWGRGWATEAGHALARYAFRAGVDEVFAVARPANDRATATAKRIGMEWVGETGKYYGLTLQVFRLRKADLDVSGPTVPTTNEPAQDTGSRS